MILKSNSVFIFFKYILKAKWIVKLPKKNNFVLVDGIYNPFLRYIKKKNFTILHRRGEEINFSILIKCFLKLKFTTLDYCVEFIKHVEPKLILTAFDYHTIFYKLSKKTGIKTLMLQKGQRFLSEGIIANSNYYFPKKSKKIFFVDYFFHYNNSTKKFYDKRITANFFETGSFENNFTKPDLNKQKEEIIFISNYAPKSLDANKSENEDVVAFYLHKLAKKNNIKFNILPRFRRSSDNLNWDEALKEEKFFYKKLLKNNYKFIIEKRKTSYDLMLNYKYIFTTYSTLGIECLVNGIRVGFIMFKSSKNPASLYRFGKMENLKKNGLFWSAFSKLNIREINRVFDFVTKTKYSVWIKKTKPYSKKMMNFDYKNKVFKNILKQHT